MIFINIQIISQYYYPDNFRINDIAEELVKSGCSVKVLTGLPDYATSKVPKEYRGFKKRKETLHGVNIKRVPIIARRKGIIFRLINYISFVVTSCFHALFTSIDADIIFSYQTSPVFQSIPGILWKKKSGKKLIIYCCDLWPESLKAWNVPENNLIFKVVKKISAWIYRSADTVAITSTAFRDYLVVVCGVDNKRIVYLPQHAEDLYSDISNKYIENRCVDFLFAGNIGSVQNVDCILKAAAMIKTSKEYRIHIVGDGSELESCKELAKELKIEDTVVFHGRHPLEEMKDFYLLSDCCLLTLRGGDFIGLTLPAKLQGYLSVGKPVLAAIDGSAKEVIVDSDCGFAVKAGDYKAYAQAMTQFIDHFEEYKQKGINGREYYEKNFTTEVFMSRFKEIYENLV